MRPIALHPLFELLEMLRVPEILNWDLMRAPGTLHRLAIDELRSCPALWGAKDYHGPARTLQILSLAKGPRGALNPAYSCQSHIERASERLMHDRRIAALNETRIIAVAVQQIRQFLAADACLHCRIGDLEAVEVKYR